MWSAQRKQGKKRERDEKWKRKADAEAEMPLSGQQECQKETKQHKQRRKIFEDVFEVLQDQRKIKELIKEKLNYGQIYDLN